MELMDIERDPFGRLVLTDTRGQRHTGVLPVRAFPLSAADEGVSLVGTDGHELLWIEALSAVPAPARTLLQEELAAREFVPEIERIASVSSFSTPSTWEVETNRGATEFVLKGEEDIRRLSETALLISSAAGGYFRIRDRSGLDRASKKLLERFL